MIRTITGTTAFEQVGFDVVELGDVNGDGRDDLVMSGANDDRVYVIAGVVGEPGGSEGSTGDEPGSSSDGGSSTAAADDGSTFGASTSTPATTTSAGEAEGGSGRASEPSDATGQGSEGSGGCGCRAPGPGGGLPWLLAAASEPWLRGRARPKGRGA